MGEIDIRAHELLSDPVEFASLFNMACFGGKSVVRPELLLEVDSVVALSGEKGYAVGKGHGDKGSLSIRDIVRCVQIMDGGGTAYMLLGIENQTAIDYAMVVRLLNYDVRHCMLQIHSRARRTRGKGDAQPFISKFGPDDRLLPIVTLVVYFGDKPWDGPTELQEMFCDLPKEIADGIKSFLPSYRIKVVSAYCTDTELDMLGPGLRAVLYYARHAHDAVGLREMLSRHPDLRTLTPLAANLISVLMNIKLDINGQEEKVDMWTVAEQLKEMGRNEGKAEGIAEGKAEGIAEGKAEGIAEGKAEGIAEGKEMGRNEGKTEIIVKMYCNGMKICEISKFTNISQSQLKKIVANHKA